MKLLKFKVVNVVASGSLGVELDLDAIAKAFPRVKYRPEIFPGLVFRLEKPKATILLFKSGKLICVGAKSEGEVEEAVLSVADQLRNAGFKFENPSFKVENIVASTDLEHRIDLAGICEREKIPASRLIYEPEQFPAAIYKMENPHITLLMFPNGKITCLRAKKTDEAAEAFNKLKEWLDEVDH